MRIIVDKRLQSSEITGFEIWNGLPGSGGGTKVMTGYGPADETGYRIIDFDGQLLPPGSYWITAYPIRGEGEDSESCWVWQGTTSMRGSEAFWHEPGGPSGDDPIAGSTLWPDRQPFDLAFRLEGDPVPVPGAVYLLGSGLVGLAGIRRKLKRRF